MTLILGKRKNRADGSVVKCSVCKQEDLSSQYPYQEQEKEVRLGSLGL